MNHIIAAQHFEGELYIKASDHHRAVRAAVAAESEARQREIDVLRKQHIEAHNCTATIFDALMRISELTDLGGEVAEYDDVVEAVKRIAPAEREECAQLCDDMVLYTGHDCAAAIRARGQA